MAAGASLALIIAIAGALLHTPEAPGRMKELLSDRASLIVVAIFGVIFRLLECIVDSHGIALCLCSPQMRKDQR